MKVEISPEVQAILNLQQIDIKIIGLKNSIKNIPSEIKKLQVKVDLVNQEYKTFEDSLKKNRLLQSTLEGDIESFKDKIVKYELQLNSIKTNEDYTKMLKEIENVKGQISEKEDELIEVMEKLEEEDSDKQAFRKKCDEKIAVINDDISFCREKEQNAISEIDALTKERASAESECSGELYARYKRYMEKKNSVVLVYITNHGACSGCHQNLPPNIRNDVMKGRIVVCDNCSRFLYWDPEKSIEQKDD